MFLKLSLLLSTIGIIACNVPFDIAKEVKYDDSINSIHQRNYQHSEYINYNTEVVYKYETNEVNDVDDLVIGNIYEINLTNAPVPSEVVRFVHLSMCAFSQLGFDNQVEVNADTDGYIELLFRADDRLGILCYNRDDTNYYSFNTDDLVVYGVLQSYDSRINNYISYFSSTDYNVIESVIYHQPQTIIGYFNEFLDENLFSEIPFVHEMTFNIGGQNINLLTYLLIAFGLVVSIGLLIGLFLLLKWLFKVFANSFILR